MTGWFISFGTDIRIKAKIIVDHFRVTLLGRRVLVVGKDRVDDAVKGAQQRRRRWLAPRVGPWAPHACRHIYANGFRRSYHNESG